MQVALWPLAGFVQGSPWFNSSAALVHSQLVCLLPVGILNLLSSFQLFVSLALKSPSGEWSFKYVCIYWDQLFSFPGQRRQSQPVEIDEEVDIDFMRAIQLSLLQHSTPANEHRCRSSSSSSSAGSGQDQAQGLGGEQDISVFSDSTSLQKAIELSLRESAATGTGLWHFRLLLLWLWVRLDCTCNTASSNMFSWIIYL